MDTLILQLLLAHIIGDFVLQSKRMVLAIEKKGFKSSALYLHTAIHILLVILFTQFQTKYIVPSLLLGISHLLIDGLLKHPFFRTKFSAIILFLVDQLLHLVCGAFFVCYFFPYTISWSSLLSHQLYLVVLLFLFSTVVSSIIIRKVLEFFSFDNSTNGNPKAGLYIGILERLFIVGFIWISFWEGIGFLLAAKSIFRFGDLRDSKDQKLTEYILIGTLLSFGLAMLFGFLFKNFYAAL